MGNRLDLIGFRYGTRTVVEFVGVTERKHSRWRVRCDCGHEGVLYGFVIKKDRQGCPSCSRQKHGATSGGKRTPEWYAWRSMKSRCSNSNSPAYANYGGRGISVCSEWQESFEAFLSHVGPRPGPGHEIDRTNNDGNYEPGNVRWVTRKENRNNRRDSKRNKAAYSRGG